MVIEVCVGSACHLKGSYEIISKIESLVQESFLEDQITIKAAFCLGHCTEAVSVKVNQDKIYSLEPNKVNAFFYAIREQVSYENT
ncbi:NADH dehydrogenase subunit E [Natranaerovirga pectinivora]|uniref:NADH dehydrogenase subunit E n=1 Tax=Natranaerovirga pectinivora TaxID=682400 RepID=A0A4R3MMI4_9FIRM|nr:NAD(P)H-dependent oxidoreductase subunit E [Natranaerovirga pectinivora]TCT16169.1 NADH dehydrogenase subunit E [Natranaerovirga pectinivora]